VTKPMANLITSKVVKISRKFYVKKSIYGLFSKSNSKSAQTISLMP